MERVRVEEAGVTIPVLVPVCQSVEILSLMRPHTLWTRILDTPGHLRYFHRFSNAFPIDIRYSLVYLDFSTYERYHMLITQPLRPITNRIAACFTYSILPTFGLSYHWRLRYFCLYHMAIDY